MVWRPEVLWRPSGVRSTTRGEFPGAVRRTLALVGEGRGGALFPTVARLGPDGLPTADRVLSGPADARLLADALAEPRFGPLVEVLVRLDAWTRWARRRYRSLLGPELLSGIEPALFGPWVSECFAACAAGDDETTRRWVLARCRDTEAFLARFLDRLRRDSRGAWFEDEAYALPLVGIEAMAGETHNGGRRVLRLRMAGGGSLAYKARPTSGESLFLAAARYEVPDSVFALLNRLPPASGEIALPELAMRAGSGPDGAAYRWQQWVEPPPRQATLRRAAGLELRAARLRHDEAERYWHRVGSLTAMCFGFGIGDLHQGNLVVGTLPGSTEPALYPVDLEVCFTPMARLRDTMLVSDPAEPARHAGLAPTTCWCATDAPAVCFLPAPDGGLALVGVHGRWVRGEGAPYAADEQGDVNCGAHFASFLRGMFDGWTALCRHRDAVLRLVARDQRTQLVRVVRRPTGDYAEALGRRLLGAPGEPETEATDAFDPDERRQLARGDVPYFLRRRDSAEVLCLDDEEPRPAATATEIARSARTWDGSALTLSGLGTALHDAALFMAPHLAERTGADRGHGVAFRIDGEATGEIAFDWRQAGQRVVYSWDHTTLRVRLEPPAEPSAGAAAGVSASCSGEVREPERVREQLLRVNRVDAALRDRWVTGGFADTALGERLERLTSAAIAWLADVVAAHGWPSEAMVGRTAADAACRLLQHAHGPREFQERCLRLIGAAAATGDMTRRDVAYLTDTLRLADGRPQLFGTKFQGEDGRLVPFPIERPDRVNERRRHMGMEDIGRYARRLRRRFPLPGPDDGWTTALLPHWNASPVLVPGRPGNVILDERSVWALIVGACVPFATGTRFRTLPDVRFFTGEGPLRVAGELLPGADDDSAGQYAKRLDARLDGSGYVLAVVQPMFLDPALWSRLRDRLDALWRQVGHPVLPLAAELIAGDGCSRYGGAIDEPTHASLTWVLRGELRAPAHVDREPVADEAAGASWARAGDLVYRPAGQTATDVFRRCLALRVHIPVDGRLAVASMRDLFADRMEREREADRRTPYLPYPPPLRADGSVADVAYDAGVVEELRRAADGPAVARTLRAVWARRVSAAGLEPVPGERPAREPGEDDMVRGTAPIVRVADGRSGSIWAVNGHAFAVTGAVTARVARRLSGGLPVGVRELCRDRTPEEAAGVLGLLRKLYTVRGVEFVAPEGD